MGEETYTIKIIQPPENGVALTELRGLSRPLTLEENQKLVGGMIELVQVRYQGRVCDMLINEERIYLDGRYNPVASGYYKDLYRGNDDYDQEMVEGLGIAGVAVLMIDHELK